MRALLDVKVLIAMLDADHSQHETAMQWFAANATTGWASCPITQNGCLRIMSNPRYANPLPASQVIERLAEACDTSFHEFWPDAITLLDPRVVDRARIHGPRQTTDLYLLALAVHHGGRLVSFDRSIPLSAVRGCSERHLLAL